MPSAREAMVRNVIEAAVAPHSGAVFWLTAGRQTNLGANVRAVPGLSSSNSLRAKRYQSLKAVPNCRTSSMAWRLVGRGLACSMGPQGREAVEFGGPLKPAREHLPTVGAEQQQRGGMGVQAGPFYPLHGDDR